jgi:hypothetical protein
MSTADRTPLAIQEYSFPRMLVRAVPVLPVFSLLSLFYTAWDPTYYHFKKARVQGRDIRVKGKTRYIVSGLLQC